MIKKQFALILILWSSFGFASTCSAQSTQDVKIYEWEEVQSASPDTIYAISFEKLKLTEVPAELAKFINIKVLNFKKNKLTALPAFFTKFDSLQVLNLEKNKLGRFPIQICQFTALKELLIGSNDIGSLPDCIEYVSNLEILDLYDNPLSGLPPSMMRMKKLLKIDFTGIRFNDVFQEQWSKQLPDTELIFDPPCDCMK
jgi:hypothetical protein